MKAKKKTKKRNPQDSTVRNVRAANKRIVDIEWDILKIKTVLHDLVRWLGERGMSFDDTHQLLSSINKVK